MQTNNKRIAKNTLALYIRMTITMVVSFLSVRVTLQILGSEDYGLNNLVGSIVAMFSFINGSMGTAVQRFYSYEIGRNNEKALARIFGVGMYLHICVALITLVIGEIFAIFFLHYLNIPQERMFAAHVVFQISLISLLFNILNVPYAAMLRAREDFDKFAMLDIFQAVGRLVVLFLLYKIVFDKLIILSILNFSITFLYIGGITWLASRYPETKFCVVRDRKIIKEMGAFISMLLFTVLFSLLRDKGIVILLNLFFGLVINAAYAIAAQIMNLASTFALNFKQAMIPQIMTAYGAGDNLRMHQLINTGTRITFILLLFITTPIIAESHFILNIVLKEVPDYAPTYTSLVLINVNISSFTYFLYQGVHATGNIKGQQIWVSSLYLLNIVLIYVVFVLGGNCYSAIYVTMFCSLLQCIVNVVYAKRTFSFDIFHFTIDIVMKSLLICITLVIYIWMMPLMEESFFRFLVRIIGIYVIIFILGYTIYLTDMEKKYCKDAIVKLSYRFVHL